MNESENPEPSANPLSDMSVEEQAALYDQMVQESVARVEADPRLFDPKSGLPLSRKERRRRGWRGPIPVGARLLRLDQELPRLVEETLATNLPLDEEE